MGEMLLNGRLYGANGIRELTQSQYDALPSSKLTDGVLYCIKDTGIVEGDQYAPVIYSLEEREIGTWVDGKPLYEVTKTFLHDNAWDGKRTQIAHGIENIDTCVSINAYGYNASTGALYLPCSRAYDDTYTAGQNASMQSDLFIDFNNFNRINFGFILGSGYTSYGYATVNVRATFRYTKSTDTPGSGSWGTDGVPMVHYDGNEKIIGTWFGETLYEKTYNFSISDLHNGDTSSNSIYGQLYLDQINYDMITIKDGFVNIKNPVVNTSLITTPINYPDGSTYVRANIQHGSSYNNDYPYIYLHLTYSASSYYNNASSVKIVITVQYTKSS